ncbi:hypothetical protein K443DRAFT_3943 [Laccaria amethystina LaAM-08-1]|uniref:Uncharacterized protein n=1 Tax=Laccaria amethystina LaAM-08-1 TaxID=1095629 RepID=A0A0C9WZM8_9AGAR|nr:hypothetical protein K443DRAFT_3943 [Laccaria amethystina LaAM-08-1]
MSESENFLVNLLPLDSNEVVGAQGKPAIWGRATLVCRTRGTGPVTHRGAGIIQHRLRKNLALGLNFYRVKNNHHQFLTEHSQMRGLSTKVYSTTGEDVSPVARLSTARSYHLRHRHVYYHSHWRNLSV